MDRNTVIGFVLLAILLFIYLFVSTKNSRELEAIRVRQEDSVARVQLLQDSLARTKDTLTAQATLDTTTTGFRTVGQEKLIEVETDVFKITFSNKGGQPRKVELKKYQSYDGKPAALLEAEAERFSYSIFSAPGQSIAVQDLYFQPGTLERRPDQSQVLTFQATGNAGQLITHTYILRDQDYLIDWTPSFSGADRLFDQGNLNLSWQVQPHQLESDVEYERQQTNIGFVENGDFDYIQTKNEKQWEQPVDWVGISQQFFNTTLIAKNKFTAGNVLFNRETKTSSDKIADVLVSLKVRLPAGTHTEFPMQWYFGPNDYRILKQLPVEDLDKMVNLGRDMYAFVRPINKYIVMPVFDFFHRFILSFGLVIAFLTLFIRLATSPLVYTSYLSGAKMKALRPEIDLLKAKYGEDQQQIGMEQMKLFREAGVNPLGGCIPALLQIPIFFALYSFFNSNIALRGQSFLWAENLASYDVIVKFPVSIWGLGSHLSLFTLTAAATSFLISLYNTNMTPDSGNPALKYMPYIFPFILLFIFNRLPSALTWYYTVSNVITLILQWVIQNYIIDHDKILAKIDANRKKPKSKSKWQERLEQMQESQKKLQDLRNKPGKK